MTIGISTDHRELSESLRSWASSLEPREIARAAEEDPQASFDKAWEAVVEMGLGGVAVAEEHGGSGGSLLDLAVMLSACAAELVPGPVLTTAIASAAVADHAEAARAVVGGSRVGFAPGAAIGSIVDDAPGADRLLVSDEAGVRLVDAADLSLTPGPVVDLTRRTGVLTAEITGGEELEIAADDVRRLGVTLAAAEAAGLAQWCLEIASDYAKVREQFGKPIGSFQAVKHLCAQMLETTQAVGAAAWDAAAAHGEGDATQWALAVDVAEATVFDGAVEVAKDCIQVLGGIGFTYEHDAHLYLRRAKTLRTRWARPAAAADRLVERALAGERRRISVDLEGADDAVRRDVRAKVEEVVAAPAAERRRALVDTGLLVPHYPEPYGLAADAVTQIVVDQELAEAGVERPDIVIAAWALPTIIEHGTQEQRERFVRPSLVGDLVWCQLFSEPGAGSDLASLRTKAEKVDGGWELTGQKVWTSVADRADWGITLARTDPDVPQHKGISYFLVDMRSAGIDIRPLREITGEALFNEVFLDKVFVPEDCLVAGEGDGWKLARTTLANERVAMAGGSLGRSVEEAVRLVAGDTAGADPVQRAALGRQIARSVNGTQLGVRSTLRSLAGMGPGAESSVAKLLGVRDRQESAELLVELYGDRLLAGDEDAIEAWRLMLNTRCLSIAGGTTQILRNVAGERILGLPR